MKFAILGCRLSSSRCTQFLHRHFPIWRRLSSVMSWIASLQTVKIASAHCTATPISLPRSLSAGSEHANFDIWCRDLLPCTCSYDAWHNVLVEWAVLATPILVPLTCLQDCSLSMLCTERHSLCCYDASCVTCIIVNDNNCNSDANNWQPIPYSRTQFELFRSKYWLSQSLWELHFWSALQRKLYSCQRCSVCVRVYVRNAVITSPPTRNLKRKHCLSYRLLSWLRWCVPEHRHASAVSRGFRDSVTVMRTSRFADLRRSQVSRRQKASQLTHEQVSPEADCLHTFTGSFWVEQLIWPRCFCRTS